MIEQLQGRELDAALARALGIKMVSDVWDYYYGEGSPGRPIPAYSDSFDEMHEVEDEIERRGLSDIYMRELAQVVAIGKSMLANLNWLGIHATAEQKARAALAVLTEAK